MAFETIELHEALAARLVKTLLGLVSPGYIGESCQRPAYQDAREQRMSAPGFAPWWDEPGLGVNDLIAVKKEDGLSSVRWQDLSCHAASRE